MFDFFWFPWWSEIKCLAEIEDKSLVFLSIKNSERNVHFPHMWTSGKRDITNQSKTPLKASLVSKGLISHVINGHAAANPKGRQLLSLYRQYHLKKAAEHNGQNIMLITTKMRTLVRLQIMEVKMFDIKSRMYYRMSLVRPSLLFIFGKIEHY